MTSFTRATLLIDEILPEFDETIVEHLIIEARPGAVYAAVRNMDFLEISSPVMDAAMWVRALPERIGRRLRGEQAASAPTAATLGELLDGTSKSEVFTGWIGLGEDRPNEIVFGAVGKVWQPDIEWRTVPATEFADFEESGFAKIAAGFSFREYGNNRTLMSYEARTANTDHDSRRRFRRYWWIVRVFVGVVLRAALRSAKRIAEGEESTPAPSHGVSAADV